MLCAAVVTDTADDGERTGGWGGEKPVHADDLALVHGQFDFRVSCERRGLGRAPGNPLDHQPHSARGGVIIKEYRTARNKVQADLHGNVGHEEQEPSRKCHL